MIDWDSVESALENAEGIAFDGCHKIYVLLDYRQVRLMREYEYAHIETSDMRTEEEMLATLKEWFEKSCALRFVQSVESGYENADDMYDTLIEQGATDEEECEECYEVGCYGDCYEDEDEDEEEEEEDEEDE